MTSYEANTAVAYTSVRSGKYIKLAEARAGEFAGRVISNLLLLGHARVRDLVQAYREGPSKNTHIREAPFAEPSSKFLAIQSGHRQANTQAKYNPYEPIQKALRELLRAGLVSPVHVPHFRSDADNRIEAGKTVIQPEEYKAKSRREQHAQHQAAVTRKLKEWKYCNDRRMDESNSLKSEKKRPLQDVERQWPEKRQRINSIFDQEVIGVKETVYHHMLGEFDDLDVRILGKR